MEKKRCPNCQVEMPVDAKMCPRCGYSSELMDMEATEKPSLKQELWHFFHKHFFLLCIFVFVLLFAGYQAYANWHNQSFDLVPVSELVRDPNSIHNINDLYISDGRNYEYLLNKKEKKIYEMLLNSVDHFEEGFSYLYSDYGYQSKYQATQSLKKINHAFIMDHPELFQYGTISYQVNETTKEVNVWIRYASSKEAYEEDKNLIETELERVKEATKSFSEYEKAKYIYEYLLKNNHYGNKDDIRSQSAISAFSESSFPVCAGFARASQLLFQRVGLTSTIVPGSIGNTLHEWNIVSIGGDFYHFDATAGSGETIKNFMPDGVLYNGFLFDHDEDYNIEESKMIPKPNGTKYLYYSLENRVYRYTGIEDLKEKLSTYDTEYVELEITNMASFRAEREEIKETLGIQDLLITGSVALIKK